MPPKVFERQSSHQTKEKRFMELPKKQYRKVIIPFEKITSNEKSIFIHQGSIMIAVSKAYLKKVLENQQQSNKEAS